jgi:hypothetical protein
MSVIAAGSLVATTSATAAPHSPHFTVITGGVTTSPASGTPLANNQKLKVTIKGFTGDTTLYVAECAAGVVKAQSFTYCDQTNVVTLTGVKGGKATTTFTVHSGTGFKPGTPAAKCAFKQPNCLLLVADSMTVADINKVGISGMAFKGIVTHVKVTSKKTTTAGKTLLFKAVTTHAKGTGLPTGKVTFKVNGKKFKSVNEPKSGKVSAKHKFTKAGTYHITVTYAGNKIYGASTGKETVHVKK